MKRTLVAAAAAALLLGGCATGETGHLDPEIFPDIAAPRAAAAGAGEEFDDEPDMDRQEAGEDGRNLEVVNVFQDAASGEAWSADVVGVDVAGPLVTVTTRLVAGDVLALEVCETAYLAAQDADVPTPGVEVRDAEGTVLALRAAGDEECSADDATAIG